jgi:putative ABC transport system permease protein
MRSLVVLSAAVFTLFSVGLNRRGFADPAAIRTGTGGYLLWGESSVPLYHNLATDEGRRTFSLDDLPAGTRFLQLLRYGADDAGCLNLNRVSEPTVLGVDMATLAGSDFTISASLDGAGSFEAFTARRGEAYPALVDATVLEWGLGKGLGDTLWYRAGGGQRVAVVLAGTLANSVFQGNILIDRTLFGEIWPETKGSEIFLAYMPDTANDTGSATSGTGIEELRNTLSRALAEYGVRVTTTADRLREFNSVADTYLSIFFTLGCLGLLLGIAGFVVAVRKNLASRGDEIRLMRALGFSRESTAQLFYRENIVIPLYGIATGVAGAVLSVAGSFANAGVWLWLAATVFATLFVFCTVRFVARASRREVAAVWRDIPR